MFTKLYLSKSTESTVFAGRSVNKSNLDFQYYHQNLDQSTRLHPQDYLTWVGAVLQTDTCLSILTI